MYSKWEIISDKEHDDFITSDKLCNVLQSCAWAKVKDRWKHVCIGIYDDTHVLMASGLVLLRKLPFNLTVFYLPRGPILDYSNVELVTHAFKDLKAFAKKLHCINITFDPCVLHKVYKQNIVQNDFTDDNQELIQVMHSLSIQHLGYTLELSSTIQPRYHAGVSLYDGFENSFPKHTKRHLKKAEKSGIMPIHGNYEMLDDFAYLMKKTEQRKHIQLRDKTYFKKILDAYGEDAGICIAYLDVNKALTSIQDEIHKLSMQQGHIADIENVTKLNQKAGYLRNLLMEQGNIIPCAGALYVRFSKTCEMLYMGMDYAFHNYMPAFVSHVEAMRWAYENGCVFCNMGGVESDIKGGLYAFKSNFSPNVNEYIGEFICPVRPVMHILYQIVNRYRLKWERFKKSKRRDR